MPGNSDLSGTNDSSFSVAHSTKRRIQCFHPAYMSTSGAPSMPWDNWLRMFKFFVTASGLDKEIKELKLAVLYNSLGANTARIVSDLTDAHTTYDDSITRLTERFGERLSVIYARTKFHRRSQQRGDDIFDFVPELKRLESYCMYVALKLELVRDRLVAGCLDDKVRERLFQEPADLTPEKAVVLAQTIERATSESKRLGQASRSHQPSAQLQVDSSQHQGRFRHNRSSLSDRRRSFSRRRSQSRQRNNGLNCYFYGYTRHPRDRCPARGHKCHKCCIQNHFEQMCQFSKGSHHESPHTHL